MSEEWAREAREAAIDRLSGYYPDYEIILTDSGTDALTRALLATKPSKGGIVALPAYACPDLGTAAIGADFEIMLYDICAESFEPEIDSVTACIANGATHVVVAHLCGRVVDVPRIEQVARRAGVVLVEDAAQHAGGTLRGIRGGGLADWSILSFGRGKGLNAGGGGALLRRISGDKAQSPSFSVPQTTGGQAEIASLGVTAITAILSQPLLFGISSLLPGLHIGETRYKEPQAHAAMPGTCARLLVSALSQEPRQLAIRRANERYYSARLRDVPGAVPVLQSPHTESGALRFPLLFKEPPEAALATHGVVRLYPRTLAGYEAIRARFHGAELPCPGAQRLAEGLHTLPTHELLGEREREQILSRLLRPSRVT